jgi:hypothetical protein
MLFQGSGCGGQVKALALVALIAAAVKIPLPSSLFGERRPVIAMRLRSWKLSPRMAYPSSEE